MKTLFLHQNFPGQFRHWAPAMRQAGHSVRALTVHGQALPGVETFRYTPPLQSPAPGWTQEFDTKVTRGAAALQAMQAMHQSGWHPDLVIAHPSWGEALFVKDLWPKAKLLCFLEFYYQAQGHDVGFDPEFGTLDLAAKARLRLKNATHLLALEAMDHGLTPTHWQRSTLPSDWQERVQVVFDGIDTDRVRPDPAARLRLHNAKDQERTVAAGDEVLTYVARNLEPYRGYHQFMRALPQIQQQRPQAVTLIVGGHGTSYGPRPPEGRLWKDIFLDEVRERIDLSRVFFLGPLGYEQYLRVLQVSACHVYLTYPFVLSWSCMEALSAGCVVVGSRTPPVEEMIDDGVNGLLVDFFDPAGLADKVCDVLSQPHRYRPLRERARSRIAQAYDLKRHSLPQQLALAEQLVRE